ncbi:hypothetical protein [Thioalkalivibrio sp. ALE23]|uniref:hypothetical protein n=1 Tax=Thioalkalivibrio sp. ALE23 TaxID=1265495 RepID=UPI0003772E48|nr:hypothetical protein [Thioalkalivibrio sp. ALE23]
MSRNNRPKTNEINDPGNPEKKGRVIYAETRFRPEQKPKPKTRSQRREETPIPKGLHLTRYNWALDIGVPILILMAFPVVAFFIESNGTIGEEGNAEIERMVAEQPDLEPMVEERRGDGCGSILFVTYNEECITGWDYQEIKEAYQELKKTQGESATAYGER